MSMPQEAHIHAHTMSPVQRPFRTVCDRLLPVLLTVVAIEFHEESSDMPHLCHVVKDATAHQLCHWQRHKVLHHRHQCWGDTGPQRRHCCHAATAASPRRAQQLRRCAAAVGAAAVGAAAAVVCARCLQQ
eukprot:19014-Heterococcus_DN1.PRE.1